jgi:hypothetical protein
MGQDSGDVQVVLRVDLKQDENGYPPYRTEKILGTKVKAAVYRIASIPMFAFGLALEDLVEVVSFEDQLWISSLIEAGGHSTARVIAFRGTDPERPRMLVKSFGCRVVNTQIEGLLAIDIPPGVDFAHLKCELRKGRESGLWDYDLGVVSDGHCPTS